MAIEVTDAMVEGALGTWFGGSHAGDGTRTLTADQVEALDGAAEEIMGSANYLKDRLDRGLEIYESMWLEGLMEVHGTLLGISEPAPSPPSTQGSGTP